MNEQMLALFARLFRQATMVQWMNRNLLQRPAGDCKERSNHVCGFCGFVVAADTVPAFCPACTAANKRFKEIACP